MALGPKLALGSKLALGPKLALVAKLTHGGTQKEPKNSQDMENLEKGSGNGSRKGRERRVVESVWELALNVDAAKGKAPQKKIIDT